MGLDMMLYGEIVYPAGETRDGFTVMSVKLELAYWRKHPNLHGFIVNTFNKGVDNCEPIWLDEEALGQIIQAIERDALAHRTVGFFFGKSPQPGETTYDDQKAEDKLLVTRALKWLVERRKKPDEGYCSVWYHASW